MASGGGVSRSSRIGAPVGVICGSGKTVPLRSNGDFTLESTKVCFCRLQSVLTPRRERSETRLVEDRVDLVRRARCDGEESSCRLSAAGWRDWVVLPGLLKRIKIQGVSGDKKRGRDETTRHRN